MKLVLKNNRVICLLDGDYSAWEMATKALFYWFYKDKDKVVSVEKFNLFNHSEIEYDELSRILWHAERHNVEISDEILTLYQKVKEKALKIREERKAKQEREERKAKWDIKCKFGCGYCPNLTYDVDVPICKVSGEILETKNEPKFDGQVYRLFNFEPYPSDGCLYKVAE